MKDINDLNTGEKRAERVGVEGGGEGEWLDPNGRDLGEGGMVIPKWQGILQGGGVGDRYTQLAGKFAQSQKYCMDCFTLTNDACLVHKYPPEVIVRLTGC